MARKKKIVITSEMAETLHWPRVRVMGIDPSISSTGWSIVDFFPQERPRLVGHGTITTASTGDMSMKSIIIRSREVFEAIREIPLIWDIDVVAIELPVPSARGVGSQSGSIAVTAVYNAIPYGPEHITLHHPTHTKKIVANNGRASKQDVKAAVTQWLGTLPRTNVDVSDSISAAITYSLEHLTEAPTE